MTCGDHMLVSIKKISKFPSQIPCSSRPPAPRPSSTRFKEVELSTTLPSFLVGQVLPNRHGPPKVDQDGTDKGFLSRAHQARNRHHERPLSQDTVSSPWIGLQARSTSVLPSCTPFLVAGPEASSMKSLLNSILTQSTLSVELSSEMMWATSVSEMSKRGPHYTPEKFRRGPSLGGINSKIILLTFLKRSRHIEKCSCSVKFCSCNLKKKFIQLK